MNIENCYEAIIKMEELSNELIVLLEKNQKIDGKLSGGVDTVERNFLTIKHSLDVITVPQYNKSAYTLGLEIVQCKNELNELFDKKQHEVNQSNRRDLGHKIDQVEEKYLTIKKALLVTTYVKNLNFV